MKNSHWILVICLLLASTAWADRIPDLNNSYATCAYQGPGDATLLVVPDGSGASFTEARDPDGTLVDATITLVVLDNGDNPVYLFPAEDLWLEAMDGGLVSCIAGTIADTTTDVNGMTQWVTPLRAGGFSTEPCQVMIMGAAISIPPSLPIVFNSPDIDGNGTVNLTDVGFFSQDFFDDYDFRSDFQRDGVLNLADVYWLAAARGVECP